MPKVILNTRKKNFVAIFLPVLRKLPPSLRLRQLVEDMSDQMATTTRKPSKTWKRCNPAVD